MREQKPKSGRIGVRDDRRQNCTMSKFQRYRRAKSEGGMRLLRLWVTDPTQPGFAEEAARQATLLRGRPEEREALSFIDAAFAWPKE